LRSHAFLLENISMSVLFTGRTEAARGRSESRPAAEPKTLDVRLYLRDLLNELAAPVARPTGSPAPGAAYLRTLIERTQQHETSRAHWVGGRACVLHGHSESQVLLRVVSGTLVEERYVPDGQGGYRFEIQTLEKGHESFLPRGAFHRLHCLKEAVTLHAFSPPPADATSPVPSELRPVLEAARQRLLAPLANLPAAPNSDSAAAARKSIVDAVARQIGDWARREDEQNTRDEVTVAAETLADFRTSGILAAPVPVELGGWGCSLAENAQAIRNLARRAPATALALAMPLGNAATARIPDAVVPDDRREELAAGRRWIAEQCLAGRILAVANSEPGAGGDLAQTKTLAARGTDGAYRLSGKKSFATIGPDADYFLCAARRVGEGRDGKDVIDGFFVARTAPGVTLDNAWDPLGMRATASVGLSLDQAPAASMLGYSGCLEGVNARHWSTVLFAAVFVGIGEGALDAATQGVGGSGAASSYIRATLARCALNLDAAAGLVEAVASDERWPLPASARDRTVRAKTFAAITAVEAATQAAMLCGGRAYKADHPVARFLHDSLAGPLLRPPVAKAMDGLADQLFASTAKSGH
jgi:alkylation response protein AidB-like acyl-CoA dehydrogenase